MSFSASYKQLVGTTGYSPNQGVWTKIQMQQQFQLQQQQQHQQQRKPYGRKRKKWLKKSGKDHAIYEISEQDEVEVQNLPSVPISHTQLLSENSNTIKAAANTRHYCK